MDLALAFQVAKANAEATAPAAPEMPGASSSKSNCLRERDCLLPGKRWSAAKASEESAAAAAVALGLDGVSILKWHTGPFGVTAASWLQFRTAAGQCFQV